MVVPVHIIASAMVGGGVVVVVCMFVVVVGCGGILVIDVGVDEDKVVAVLADVSVVNVPSFVHVVSLYVKV